MTQSMTRGSEAQFVFVLPPSASLLCGLCQRLFCDPHISVTCGHTYCRQCVVSETACPLDARPMGPDKLIPNLAVSGQIDDLVIFCRFAVFRPAVPSSDLGQFSLPHGRGLRGEDVGICDSEAGCTEQITIGSREEHEQHCSFAPVPCPNGRVCPPIRRRDLGAHLEVCSQYKCTFAPLGCPFVGTKASVAAHQDECDKGADPVVQQRRALEKLRKLCETLEQSFDGFSRRLDAIEQKQRTHEELGRETSKNVKELRKQLASSRLPAGITANMAPSEAIGAEGELIMPFNFQCIGTFEAHTGTVWCVTSHQNYLFTTGSDEKIFVWDVAARQPYRMKVLHGHTGVIHSLCVQDGFLISGDSERTVIIWDLEKLEAVKSFIACDDIVASLVYAQGQLFAASFAAIQVWNLDLHNPESLNPRFTITGDLNHWVRALAVDDAGEKVYSVTHNLIHIWDARSLEIRSRLETKFGSVHSLLVTPKYIVCGTYNRNIHIYDVNTLEYQYELWGHLGTVHALAINGEFLFSASIDTTIKIWNLENRLLVQTLTRHEGSVNAVHWHNDLLFSGSADKRIKLFKPFKGKAITNGPETPAKEIEHQACWGSAQLPPRLPPARNSATRKSLQLELGSSPLASAPGPGRRLEHVYAEAEV
eukprot:m.10239 g.10239  ORF g.10239 m.10239 type:complete len:648 (+) comp3070_c0_seq1:207-2150(+)